MGAAARDYLNARGVSEWMVEKLGIYFTREWPYTNRIIIPVRQEGKVVTFQARQVPEIPGGNSSKYLSPSSLPTRNYIFTVSGKITRKRLILVEGIFDAIRLWEFGFRNVGALFGKTVTNSQLETLKHSPVKKIILMLDHDAVKETAQAWRRLAPSFDVEAVLLPPSYDPGTLDERLLLKVLSCRTDSILQFTYEGTKQYLRVERERLGLESPPPCIERILA